MMQKRESRVRSFKFFYIFLIQCLISQIAGLGQVEVVFQTLSTPDSKLSDGSTCKDSLCDIKIKVEFLEPDLHRYKTDNIKLQGDLTLDQTGAGALNDKPGTEFNNPVSISAPSQKKLVQFSVKVEVDDYSNYRKIKMATLELTEDVTTGVIYDKTLTDGSLTMTLSFKVICEENYYFDCSVFCVEQDDNLGHFTCDPVTGDPVCLEGWTGDDCLTRTCTSDLDMTGGTITSSPQAIYSVGETITIECDPEYKLNSQLQSNVLTCEGAGQWSYQDFTNVCTKKVTCTSGLVITDGRVTSTPQVTYYEGDTVTVECDPEYELNTEVLGNSLTCGGDGGWSFNNLSNICTEIKRCPTVNSLHLLSSSTEDSSPGDTVRLSCDSGFSLWQDASSIGAGYLNITCQEDGTWGCNLPTCREDACKSCAKLKEPTHGSLTYSSLNACAEPGNGSAPTPHCAPHYVPLVKYQGLECDEDGDWRDYSGEAVREGARRFIDCIATGENETEIIEDNLERGLGNSALFVAGITLLAFFTFITVYCFTHKRQKEKMKISPSSKEKLYGNEKRSTTQSTGIGHVDTESNVSAVKNDGYFNQGFVHDEFDYDF